MCVHQQYKRRQNSVGPLAAVLLITTDNSRTICEAGYQVETTENFENQRYATASACTSARDGLLMNRFNTQLESAPIAWKVSDTGLYRGQLHEKAQEVVVQTDSQRRRVGGEIDETASEKLETMILKVLNWGWFHAHVGLLLIS